MSLKLNSSGGGSITLQEPSTASNRTLTLPDNTGNLISSASTGVITQSMLGAGVAGNGPTFFATKSSGGNQSIAGNVWTKITFPNEDWDTNSNYDASTSRFTPTIAGYYMIRLACAVTNTVGTQMSIYKNGFFYSGQNSASDWIEAVSILYLNGTTDYVEGYVYNGSGFSVYQNGQLGQFMGVLVRAA